MGRLVIIGLDAFHEELLKYTPFIESKYQNASSGPLESTKPPVTAPAWASFQTGKNQGKHGVYDFVNYNSKFEMDLINGERLRSKTFYEYLDEAGYDCLLYNLPFTTPPRIEGDIVPSWLTEGVDPTPADLYDQYNISPPEYPELNGSKTARLRILEESFEHNAGQFEQLFEEGDYDVLFQLLSETDWAQHVGYKHLKQNRDSDTAAAMEELFRKVDAYIERLFEKADKEDTIALISDHGFKLHEGRFYINDWLNQNGFLQTGSDDIKSKDDELSDRKSYKIGNIGRKLLRFDFLYPALSWSARVTQSLLGLNIKASQSIDLENSDAYCLSKDEAGIRINPDLDDEDHKKVVISCLEQLNREPSLSAQTREDVYWGPYVEEAGEIILSSDRYYILDGPIGREKISDTYAHHSSEGIFIFDGPQIDAEASVGDAKLIDIAPTVLWLLDQDVPTDMDGEVLDLLTSKPVSYQNPPDYVFETTENNQEGSEAVEDRLESLGYL